MKHGYHNTSDLVDVVVILDDLEFKCSKFVRCFLLYPLKIILQDHSTRSNAFARTIYLDVRFYFEYLL